MDIKEQIHVLSEEMIENLGKLVAVDSQLGTPKPQPRERAWQNQRGKKTLLSLTLVRLCEMT